MSLGIILFGYMGIKLVEVKALLLTGISLVLSSLIVLILSVVTFFISTVLQGLSLGDKGESTSFSKTKMYLPDD